MTMMIWGFMSSDISDNENVFCFVLLLYSLRKEKEG